MLLSNQGQSINNNSFISEENGGANFMDQDEAQNDNTTLEGTPSTKKKIVPVMCLYKELFLPEVLKLAILSALQKDSKHANSMHNLESFVNNLTHEKRHVILSENGLSLSTSMFIPYSIMGRELLCSVQRLLDSDDDRCTFTNAEKTQSVAFVLGQTEILGVIDVICAVLLIMSDANDINTHLTDGASRTNIMSIFDVILKSICFKKRVDYSTILQMCVDHGYKDTSLLSLVHI